MQKFNSFKMYLYAILFLFSANSYSQKVQDCRVFEFAEMQTMSPVELRELYCTNLSIKKHLDSLKEGREEAASQMTNLIINAIRTGQKANQETAKNYQKQYYKEGSEYNRKGQICVAENNRVIRLINKDKSGNIEPPTCN